MSVTPYDRKPDMAAQDFEFGLAHRLNMLWRTRQDCAAGSQPSITRNPTNSAKL
jgi:hypothetical protein